MPEILIVDDSVSVRKALEITFRNHALDSRSAASGEQALEMLDEAAATCDLLMVDVIMPGMSGLELCTRLKADARSAHLPVILMSGNVDDEIRAQAREAGASGVLRKPFRSEELIPLVQEVLAAHRPAAGGEAAGPAPVAPAIDDGHLGALNALLQTYEDHPQVRDVVILDRQGQPLKQTGNVLPENIQLFARFFTNTAGVLGRQMLGEDIDQVSIRYGAHQMVIHNLPGHFVVVLMGAPEGGARVVH